MATEAIFDYANATVRMPLLMRKLDDQLNDKKWEEAEKTRNELAEVTKQLGVWLAGKINTKS